ncbi:MFS transporter [Geminicoccaceae bacterium 1502E]|nr:MFS transporter [Geminicoccaceae bacterium 1502E]
MTGPWPILALCLVLRVGMGLQFQTVATVGPLLVESLAIDYALLGTLIGAYLLPGVFVSLPGGWLMRRFGDRRIVLLGLALMTAGGLLMAVAASWTPMLVGRLMSGSGGALLNMVLVKIVADRFSGRALVVAMGWLLTGWPLGIALSLVALGTLGEAWGAPAVMIAGAGFCGSSLALFALLYREGREQETPAAGRATFRPGELPPLLVSGIIWALFNACLVVVLGFAPAFLATTGLSVAEAAAASSLVGWVIIPALPLGAWLAARIGRPNVTMLASFAGTALLIALLAGNVAPLASLVLLGAIFGPPGGLLMALPAQTLRPENRAFGMGVFYTIYYVGMASLPAVAGLARDLTGAPQAPLHAAAAMILAAAALLPLFRVLERRRQWRLALSP